MEKYRLTIEFEIDVEAENSDAAIDKVPFPKEFLREISPISINECKKFVIVMDGKIHPYIELYDDFCNMPEEIRWGDYCDSFEEWLYQRGGLIVEETLYTPSYFGDYEDDTSFDEFDSTSNFRTYPLDEAGYLCKEHKEDVLLIKFKDLDEPRLAVLDD